MVSLCNPRTDLDKAGLKLRDLQALHAAHSLSYGSALLFFYTYFPAKDLLMSSFLFPFSKMVRFIKAGRSLVLDVPQVPGTASGACETFDGRVNVGMNMLSVWMEGGHKDGGAGG